MKTKLTIVLLVICIYSHAQIITTIAGSGTCCTPIDGGQATASSLYDPNGIAFDAVGNLYVSEPNKIRKINTSGIISTIAGSTGGYSGDGGLAINAKLNSSAIAIDNLGNIYSADFYHHVVRKINTSGIITTFAGNSSQGYSGDGGLATNAELNSPYGLAVDALGNLYIADTDNNRIRKVSTTGIITTVAGIGTQGYSGDGSIATGAELHSPHGITFDNNGNLYIADWNNNCVRMVDSTGIITTFAGTGLTFGFSGDGGLATSAELRNPKGITIDSFGNLYISDSFNGRIRMVNTSGIINTVAGNGIYGFSGDGGQATLASFATPLGISIYSSNLYIADLYNFRIRKISNITSIEKVNTDNSIVIYPNPFTEQTIIQTNDFNDNTTLTIYNSYGKTVKQVSNISGKTVHFFRDNLSSGLYLVRLSNDNKALSECKLVISDN